MSGLHRWMTPIGPRSVRIADGVLSAMSRRMS
jgi:hypothetical protein